MKSYTWWKQQKRRVQKKYTLFLGQYYSPKETKALERKLIRSKKHVEGKKETE